MTHSAREACLQLLSALCVAQDRGVAHDVAAVFAEDGRWTRSDGLALQGRDAIERFHVDRFAQRGPEVVLRHMMSTAAVTVEGERAHCTSYALVYRGVKGGALGPPGYLMLYETDFVRTAEGWRMSLHDSSVSLGPG